MNDSVQGFLSCCQLVLQGDAQLLAQLRAQGFVCAAGRWDFSLPALHAYLSGEGDVDYRRWLRQLYASEINARLREQGAEIVILDNRGKLDSSLYGLRHLPAQ